MTRIAAMSAVIAAVVILLPSPAHAQGYGESPYIFGVHDENAEGIMEGQGKTGWITISEGIGRDPYNNNGRDYRPWADRGHGVIVRLNNDYGPTGGTIPYQKHYDDFAQRCANYVYHSPGCHIWIIGNEMNLTCEWPGYEGWQEVITVSRYVQCFNKVRAKIKTLPGHANDQVIPGAIGTWAFVPEVGYWLDYWSQMLAQLNGKCDALAIHTYTHDAAASAVTDNTKMQNPPGAYWQFRAYIDFMNRIPSGMRSLPVYITETNEGGPWVDQNIGWVKEAYKEINRWNNLSGTQKIRALCLYRFIWWTDQWQFEHKPGVIQDWKEAMNNEYRWDNLTPPPPPPPPPPEPNPSSDPEVLSDGSLRWQAEHYSGGADAASGIDYWDGTSGNSGGAYRHHDVDIEACAEGGYSVGWTRADEWLRYTYTGGGTFEAEIRYAAYYNSSCHIEVDGVNITGSISLPATGGWQSWATAANGVEFTLGAGSHSVKFVCETSGFNLNHITFAPAGGAPPPPGPSSDPEVLSDGSLRWQAENYSGGNSAASGVDYWDATSGNAGGQFRSDDVDIEVCSEGGYNVGWSNPGEWMRYTFNGSGTFKAEVRYAASWTGTVHIEVDGADVTGPISLNASGGWQSWNTATGTAVFDVAAGDHYVKLVFDSTGFNINHFTLRATDPAPPPAGLTAIKVSVSGLNVRQGPSTAYSVIGVIHTPEIYFSGEQDGSWYKIWFDGREGWTHGGYVTEVTGITGVEITGTLNVRTGPSTAYTILGQVTAGERFNLVEIGGDYNNWYKIHYGGREAWVWSGLAETFQH